MNDRVHVASRGRWLSVALAGLLLLPFLVGASGPAEAYDIPVIVRVSFPDARFHVNLLEPSKSMLHAFMVEPWGARTKPVGAWIRPLVPWRVKRLPQNPRLIHVTDRETGTELLQVNLGRSEVRYRFRANFGLITPDAGDTLLKSVTIGERQQFNGQLSQVTLHLSDFTLDIEPDDTWVECAVQCHIQTDEMAVSKIQLWEGKRVENHLYHVRQKRPFAFGQGLPHPDWIWDRSFLKVDAKLQMAWWVLDGALFGNPEASGSVVRAKVGVLSKGGWEPAPRTSAPPADPPPQPAPEVKPRLLQPEPGALMDNGRTDRKDAVEWDFRWSAVPGVDAYQFVILRPDGRAELNMTVPGTARRHHVPAGLIAAHELHGWTWMVRTYTNGAVGPWAGPRHFSVEAPDTDPSPGGVAPPVRPAPSNPAPTVGAPRLVSPAQGAVMDNGRTDSLDPLTWDFAWSRVPGATYYQIVVQRSGQDAVVNASPSGTTYHHATAGGAIGQAFLSGWTWRVRAIFGSAPGPWSELRTFRVEPANTDPIPGAAPPSQPGPAAPAASGAPTLISPPPNAVLDNGRTDRTDPLIWDFNWSAVPGAESYHIVVGRQGQNPVVDGGGPGTTWRHFQASVFIAPAHLHGWTWRVRAVVGGVAGPWSEARPFRVEDADTDPRPGAR